MNANLTTTRIVKVLIGAICFWSIYYYGFVPVLEPPVPSVRTIVEPSLPPPQSPYISYFKEGAWERNTDMKNLFMLNNIVLLSQKLVIDKSLRITSEKSTILFAPGMESFPVERPKDFYPVIISILKGAEIQLSKNDNDFSPRPQKGRLFGQVTINYKSSIKDQLVDCFLTTSELTCTKTSLTTPQPVHFELGTLIGDGEDLRLDFQPPAMEDEFFSGISTIRLNKVKKITLTLPLFLIQQLGSKLPQAVKETVEKMFGPEVKFPITLTCDGPMLYNVETGIISFSDNVVIECHYPTLPHDRLECEQLSIRLTPDLREQMLAIPNSEMEKTSDDEVSTATSDTLDNNILANNQPLVGSNSISADEQNLFRTGDALPIDSILAKNVQLIVPTFNGGVKTEVLEFHFPNQTLQLSGSEQSDIVIAQHEFHATKFSYTFPTVKGQSMGTILVDGEGWFRTHIENPQVAGNMIPLRMIWQKKLSSSVYGMEHYNVQVQGNVEIESELIGRLTADQIQGILRPKTPQDEEREQILATQMNVRLQTLSDNRKMNMNFVPERFIASGNVKIKAQQMNTSLDAKLEEIRLDFLPANKMPDALLHRNVQSVEESTTHIQNGNISGEWGKKTSQESRQFVLKNASLSGKILLLPGDFPFYISQMALNSVAEKNLHLYEQSYYENSDQQISLLAKSVMLHDLMPETLQCEINGAPAILTGKGILLKSPKIVVNCAANRIDINNAGEMHFFQRNKNKPYDSFSAPVETVFSWDKNLSFDGQSVTTMDNVQIKSLGTFLRADKIQAELSERIQLNAPPRIENNTQGAMLDFFTVISASQNVRLRHKNYNMERQLSDVFVIQTQYADFRPSTMELNVSGRGAIRLSYFGEIDVAEQTKPNANDLQTASEPEWFQVYMEYYGGINGNLANGEFTINNQITALAHPVPDPGFEIPWSWVNQKDVPAKGFQLSCDKIYVSHAPTFQLETFQPMNVNASNVEMTATGNVRMENSIYTAVGNELKYSQEKGTCSIAGTQGKRVLFTIQKALGGTRKELEYAKIKINLKNMKYEADDTMIDYSLGE